MSRNMPGVYSWLEQAGSARDTVDGTPDSQLSQSLNMNTQKIPQSLGLDETYNLIGKSQERQQRLHVELIKVRVKTRMVGAWSPAVLVICVVFLPIQAPCSRTIGQGSRRVLQCTDECFSRRLNGLHDGYAISQSGRSMTLVDCD